MNGTNRSRSTGFKPNKPTRLPSSLAEPQRARVRFQQEVRFTSKPDRVIEFTSSVGNAASSAEITEALSPDEDSAGRSNGRLLTRALSPVHMAGRQRRSSVSCDEGVPGDDDCMSRWGDDEEEDGSWRSRASEDDRGDDCRATPRSSSAPPGSVLLRGASDALDVPSLPVPRLVRGRRSAPTDPPSMPLSSVESIESLGRVAVCPAVRSSSVPMWAPIAERTSDRRTPGAASDLESGSGFLTDFVMEATGATRRRPLPVPASQLPSTASLQADSASLQPALVPFPPLQHQSPRSTASGASQGASMWAAGLAAVPPPPSLASHGRLSISGRTLSRGSLGLGAPPSGGSLHLCDSPFQVQDSLMPPLVQPLLQRRSSRSNSVVGSLSAPLSRSSPSPAEPLLPPYSLMSRHAAPSAARAPLWDAAAAAGGGAEALDLLAAASESEPALSSSDDAEEEEEEDGGEGRRSSPPAPQAVGLKRRRQQQQQQRTGRGAPETVAAATATPPGSQGATDTPAGSSPHGPPDSSGSRQDPIARAKRPRGRPPKRRRGRRLLDPPAAVAATAAPTDGLAPAANVDEGGAAAAHTSLGGPQRADGAPEAGAATDAGRSGLDAESHDPDGECRHAVPDSSAVALSLLRLQLRRLRAQAEWLGTLESLAVCEPVSVAAATQQAWLALGQASALLGGPLESAPPLIERIVRRLQLDDAASPASALLREAGSEGAAARAGAAEGVPGLDARALAEEILAHVPPCRLPR